MNSKILFLKGLLLIIICINSTAQVPSKIITPFKYPVPKGKYQVGTKFLTLSDRSRPDIYTTDKNDFRTISLQIWYPAEPRSNHLPLSYYNEKIADKFVDMGMFIETFKQDIALHPSYSFQDAPILKMGDPFPLVLYSSSGIMNANIFLFENLASLGYVVVSIGHPHWCLFYFDNQGNPNFPDYEENLHYQKMWAEERSEVVKQLKEQITLTKNIDEKRILLEELNQAMPEEIGDVKLWVRDFDFVIDELSKLNADREFFQGMVDLNKIAITGYSKGGVAAAHACMTDRRFAAGINLSGFMFGDIHKNSIKVPFMNLESEESWCDDCESINDIIYHNAESDVFMIQIQGATHGNFTDLSAYKSYISPNFEGLLGSIEGLHFLDIQYDYIHSFLSQYLKQKPSISPEWLSRKYNDVRFKTNTEKLNGSAK